MNCHWCGRSYDEVALDALAAYTAATEYPGETVKDRNIRSRAYLEGLEALLICNQECWPVAAKSLRWVRGAAMMANVSPIYRKPIQKFITSLDLFHVNSCIPFEYQQC